MPLRISGKQYSGSWTMQQHLQAVSSRTWTLGGPKLYSWGLSTSGLLGQNELVDKSSPTQVGSLANCVITR